jgi:ElaB/YqjD/DUF883 family membrane-anchored ribosome-binding protein
MKATFDQLVSDMQKVLQDLEGLIQAVQEEKACGAHTADAGVIETRIERLRASVRRVRGRVAEQLERRANAADLYMRDHAWKLLAVTTGFVLGMLMRRRRD